MQVIYMLENLKFINLNNYLITEDANNLYGHAMSQLLPYKNLEFSNVNIEDVFKTPDDNYKGYIVEVDLHIPEELHDKFKEFPPCPEIMAPSVDLFSDYQKS